MSAMWVRCVTFLFPESVTSATEKCRSRPEGSDAVGGFRGSNAPAPLAIATVTRGDVRACGVRVAPDDEARAPRLGAIFQRFELEGELLPLR